MAKENNIDKEPTIDAEALPSFPNWVSNPSKFLRATKELKAKGTPVTEDAIKDLYILYGGLVLTSEIKEELEERKAFMTKTSRKKK